MNELKLNLGCGKDIREGYVNLDSADIDLNNIPYLYEDNSIDEIILSHILEHLLEPYKVVMECHRILKPNGKLIVKLPAEDYGICHLRGRHMRNYMYAFDTRNEIKNYQIHPSFEIKIKPHLRSVKGMFYKYLHLFLNLIYDEWEFIMTKREK